MRVIRETVSRRSELRSENFTGRVWRDLLLDNSARSEIGMHVSAVFFEPGSRTYWHTHEGGQVIYVTYGEGRVGTAAGVETLRAGDLVFSPAGEEHWHGAAPDFVFHQIAFLTGVTRFGREVSAHEYESAPS